MQKEMQLTFTTEEVNIILKGLGNLKFKTVYALIGKIQNQANSQLNQNGADHQNGATNGVKNTKELMETMTPQ